MKTLTSHFYLLQNGFHAEPEEVQYFPCAFVVHSANARKPREGTPVVFTPEWLPCLYHTFC